MKPVSTLDDLPVTVLIPKSKAPSDLFGYSPGDSCTVTLDVVVDMVSQEDVRLEIKKVHLESKPRNMREAAERVKNEEKYTKLATQHVMG